MDETFIYSWSANDHRLYAEWLDNLNSNDWFTSACATEWIEIVWEKQVYPSEVGEYAHSEQQKL